MAVRRAFSGRGFSFVELLVTIVIAGIAFAALVPLFVSATEVNSADTMRNIALNVAQEKIELIRELEWSSIVADKAQPAASPNLYNPSFGGGQFGPSWTTSRGRTFLVDYTVEDVANPSVPGVVAYKAVTVTVSWQSPPSPVKPVRLTTFVYRQYQGAKVLSLTADPLTTDWGLPVGQSPPASLPSTVTDPLWPGYIKGAVTLTAKTDSPAEMVTFYAYSGDGAEITAALQALAPTTTTTTFTTPFWTPPAGRDGWYFFTAVATAAGYSGNTVQQTYYVETGPPLAPTGLSVIPGSGKAILKWTRPSAGDLSHYNVYRGLISGNEVLIASDVKTEGFEDTGLVDGTTYYYRVSAVDVLGKESAQSGPVAVNPATPADATPPTPPSDLSATVVGPTVTLNWAPSSDDVALAGYFIYRDKDLTTEIGRVDAGGLSYTDLTAGYSAAHTYTVRAYDTSANLSWLATLAAGMPSNAGWLSVSTPAQVSYTLVVATNQNNVVMTAWNVDTGKLYTAGNNAMKNKPATFDTPKLPSGTYVVTASWGASTISKTVNVFNEPTADRIDF